MGSGFTISTRNCMNAGLLVGQRRRRPPCRAQFSLPRKFTLIFCNHWMEVTCEATRDVVNIFSKRKRSQIVAAARPNGNKDTELKLAATFRTHGI
jgi:hypothetical protein